MDEKETEKKIHMPFLLQALRLNSKEWPWILLGSIGAIMFGAVQPLFALLVSEIFYLFGQKNFEEESKSISLYAGLIFLIGVGGGVGQLLIAIGFSKSGEALTMRLRKITFAAILRQEISFFDCKSNSTGALVTRLSSDASALKVICFVAFIFLK